VYNFNLQIGNIPINVKQIITMKNIIRVQYKIAAGDQLAKKREREKNKHFMQ